MPKMKTKRAVAKRCKVTPTGKVSTTQANTQHRNRNSSQATLRRQRGTSIISEHLWANIKRMLPYGR
jgi:large subunit ribosomal protein L35